ncbi:hypothetical protein AAC03nite_25720 [Alicyclobacillus acidoterrestris]|nr:hypothetical protein AAC03nite_25720 [Alicyclobacillus acidoterrestris]
MAFIHLSSFCIAMVCREGYDYDGQVFGLYFGIKNIELVNGMLYFSHYLVCEEKSSGMLCS